MKMGSNYIFKITVGVAIFVSAMTAFAQTGNVVLIEVFSETGCGACAEYDSSFKALTDTNADKVAVISYHCFYSQDPFFTYNRTGDQRYAFYKIKDGFPTAMVNGKKAGETSAHLYFVKAPVIQTMYNQPAQFNLDVRCVRSKKNNLNTAELKLKVTALKENPSKDLRLFVVATENNIDYKERYHSTTSNGLNTFNHIMRAMLPDTNGIVISPQTIGKVNKAIISYTNDDKEIHFNEVQFIVFVQDIVSKEVLGATVVKETPVK